MILDEEKVSKLLNDNKEEEMEHPVSDYKSHNTYVMPNNREDQRFWEFLVAWGIIDRNGNKNITETQLQSLATQYGTTSAEMASKIDRLILAQCEQTGTITNAIHTASTANLVGQNALGEKLTDNAYKSLLDGGVTRKNDDDNTKYLSNQSTLGFQGVEKSLCDLSSKISSENCGIKELIKDNKYELKEAINNSEYRLSTQATHNYNALDKEIVASRTEALVTNKNDQIRLQEMENQRLRDSYTIARDKELKDEIEELKSGRLKDAEINIFSKNIDSFNNRVGRLEDLVYGIDRRLVAIGNNINIGGGSAGDKG